MHMSKGIGEKLTEILFSKGEKTAMNIYKSYKMKQLEELSLSSNNHSLLQLPIFYLNEEDFFNHPNDFYKHLYTDPSQKIFLGEYNHNYVLARLDLRPEEKVFANENVQRLTDEGFIHFEEEIPGGITYTSVISQMETKTNNGEPVTHLISFNTWED